MANGTGLPTLVALAGVSVFAVVGLFTSGIAPRRAGSPITIGWPSWQSGSAPLQAGYAPPAEPSAPAAPSSPPSQQQPSPNAYPTGAQQQPYQANVNQPASPKPFELGEPSANTPPVVDDFAPGDRRS